MSEVAYVGYMRYEYKILITEPEGMEPLGRLRHKWGTIILKWILNRV